MNLNAAKNDFNAEYKHCTNCHQQGHRGRKLSLNKILQFLTGVVANVIILCHIITEDNSHRWTATLSVSECRSLLLQCPDNSKQQSLCD